MVHTHGDTSRAATTRDLTFSALQKVELQWDDVEDVFPLSGQQIEDFEASGKMAGTIRASFVARHAITAKIHQTVESALAH